MAPAGNSVAIEMNTTITDGERRETHEMNAEGMLYRRGGMTVIRFEEPKDDPADDITLQTVKLSGAELSVNRKGHIAMKQRFVEGLETEGSYHSPYGKIAMQTETHEVNYAWDEIRRRGYFELRYTLSVQGDTVGEYHLYASLKEV
ncbi:DUF1934 domain-containing protein [Salisediminibacterium halotolerans]|uniref:Uncharacterized beta-barrel protein YwiB, DUF1934 family n=1 Tax=Salisediminibacterium halotolerans TaxID=517425 RepID=A0A1H9QWU8_9BACI|nr:DUF1934 domain-containing protein [Salisediminibacterium haloalkalitolerans]SER64183.1 Uncharacterized beta-barrel protein YwiB, DUF1934 family [Salisediminibacterium haloalkalitolerans]